jgi:hypothetical protein
MPMRDGFPGDLADYLRVRVVPVLPMAMGAGVNVNVNVVSVNGTSVSGGVMDPGERRNPTTY